jgi:hypothetical protein
MKFLYKINVFLFSILLFHGNTITGQTLTQYDIVIYGGTSAGVAAAIQSSRMGKSVVLIEPSQHVGGLTTGGLGATDIGNKSAIGGISREFYQNIKKYYEDPANWKWQTREEYFAQNESRTADGEDAMWTLEEMYHYGDPLVPWINTAMPNRKTDTNNQKGFSTDFIGQNFDYPEASYEEKEAMNLRHLEYQQGLMWSLANHPRIPKEVREVVSQWGMSKDEFTEQGGWTPQLYVREARRMISDYVISQKDCEGLEVVEDPVGLAAYKMDSHMVQRYVDHNGYVQNEGNVEAPVTGPYPISYRSIIPKKGEAENLLVPVCVSSTHIAFGSIRMEPVFMVLGQSAATAASLAIDKNLPLHQLPYAELKQALIQGKQVLQHQ